MSESIRFHESQSRAIQFGNGSALVLAGPGSGKTTVLTHRMQYLIENLSVLPEHLLVLTFTKAAAQEMEQRFHVLTRYRYPKVRCGTFHSFFWQVLRETYGYTVDRLLDEEKQKEVLGTCMGEPHLSEARKQEYAYVLGCYRSADEKRQEELRQQIPYLKELDSKYQSYKKEKGLLDYDDLGRGCYTLFQYQPEVLELWQDHYPYILVDEFQDANREQYAVLQLLARKYGNLYVVGDDAQSLYGFRGARPELMQQFLRDLPAKRLSLSLNYRSDTRIVETAEHLLQANKSQLPRQIESASSDTGTVLWKTCEDQAQEAEFLIRSIQQYHRNGTSWLEMAVLSRTTRGLMIMRRYLKETGIPTREQDQKLGQGITLSTYHGSKGLEYDLVCLPGLMEGMVPDPKARSLGEIEEERRMLYVAMTRARHVLIMTTPALRHGKYTAPSRFLQDMGLTETLPLMLRYGKKKPRNQDFRGEMKLSLGIYRKCAIIVKDFFRRSLFLPDGSPNESGK